jgi:pilus assembly protein CpaB
MRPKSVILIVIALGCGLVASIGISQVMENRGDGPLIAPTEKIYVSTTDIPLGQILTPEMVKLEEWPEDKIPGGAVRSLEQIEGRRPVTRLYPGEPILGAKLIDADKFYGASDKIPKGFRVASVNVTMDSSASGLVNPGDSVDVLVFLRQGRGVSITGTRTILKNVTVFAVNDRFQRDPADESSGLAKTVSLLVKPAQVERLMLAQELGRIKLSLRRSDDEAEDLAAGATIADLNAGTAGENRVAKGMEPGGIADFLKGMKASGDTSADISKQVWVMHIHTPNDVQVFNWDDPRQLPRELLGTTSANSAPVTGAPFIPPTDPNFGAGLDGETSLGDDTSGLFPEGEPTDTRTETSATLLD